MPEKRRHIASSEVFEVSLKMLAFERDHAEVEDYKFDPRSIDLWRDRASLALEVLRKVSKVLNGPEREGRRHSLRSRSSKPRQECIPKHSDSAESDVRYARRNAQQSSPRPRKSTRATLPNDLGNSSWRVTNDL